MIFYNSVWSSFLAYLNHGGQGACFSCDDVQKNPTLFAVCDLHRDELVFPLSTHIWIGVRQAVLPVNTKLKVIFINSLIIMDDAIVDINIHKYLSKHVF